MNAADQFAHWTTVRRDLLRGLDRITDEQLQFCPREGLWTLGKVARHIAEAEEGWFRFVVTRERMEWPEFRDEDSPTVESIVALLDKVHGRTQAFLESTDANDLDRTVEAPWDQGLPLRWIIWHVLEHEIHHRGEIYLMLGLMGVEAPDV